MAKLLNRVFSVLAHPLLMSTYALCILLCSDYPPARYMLPKAKLYLLEFVFAATVLFPLMSLFVMYFRKQISSFINLDQKERRIPYIIAFVFNIVTLLLFQRIKFLPVQINLIPLIVASINLFLMMVNFKFRISIYAAALGFLTAFACMMAVLFELNFLLLILTLLILSGIILSIRVWLNFHNSKEIYYAYCLSFVITVVFCALIR